MLVREIERLGRRASTRARDRPLQIMEVCGGHTHSIFRYGIERHAAATRIEFVHGPGLPGVRAADGPRRRLRRARRAPGVIFTTFGDAMRVPGSKKSLLQAKADGADVRMVYSPLDALTLARENPEREVVFFGLGFETTMPSTALTVLQAEREGIAQLLAVLQPHHDHADHQGDPRFARICSSTASSGPATSAW